MGAQQAWTRDAIPAEKPGFDCAKGHPAMGNYHHHQNPSAFKLDKEVISTVCNLYDSDGLYVINENEHSPLIGFAYDGFPIYGAYAFTNVDGTGPITRMKSGYQLRTDTTRVNGPKIGQVVGNQTMFNGYFREDYEFVAHNNDPAYLDKHNGRFCITPEYPSGIYCYFATVDEEYNSAYPYVVGPTFYGVRNATKVTTINEATTTYGTTSSNDVSFDSYKISVYPIPSSDFIAVQFDGLVNDAVNLELINMDGKVVDTKSLQAGSTIAYFETDKLYAGSYFVRIIKNDKIFTQKVSIAK
jgi:YHYH protein/Secretion system C-terminal sorting domain